VDRDLSTRVEGTFDGDCDDAEPIDLQAFEGKPAAVRLALLAPLGPSPPAAVCKVSNGTDSRDDGILERPVLDPLDRDSEFLFGLIMALTFTCTLSAARTEGDAVLKVALGALACNIAWGIVDAVMYLLSCLAQRGRSLVALRRLRSAKSVDAARPVIENALPDSVVAVLSPQELDEILGRMSTQSAPQGPAHLERADYLAAAAIFVVVFSSAIPVVLPLLLLGDHPLAIRISNAVAVVLLFLAGWKFGQAIGAPPLSSALSMVALGFGLVAITILLGG